MEKYQLMKVLTNARTWQRLHFIHSTLGAYNYGKFYQELQNLR